MTEWQPIETAPKDSSLIWLATPGAMRLGFWSAGKEHECYGSVGGGWRDFAKAETRGASDLSYAPTHWMALPKPPRAVTANDQT